MIKQITEMLHKLTVDQWIKIGFAVLAVLVGGTVFVIFRITKTNKAKVKNVKNSKITIRQENK